MVIDGHGYNNAHPMGERYAPDCADKPKQAPLQGAYPHSGYRYAGVQHAARNPCSTSGAFNHGF